MKKFPIYILIFVLSSWLAIADAEKFAEAKKLIDSKIPCSSLNENQLEILGDYLMEQMHPGEAHEVMDKMMGGEGSESLRLTHIAMARRIYCNDLNASVNYWFEGMMGLGYGRGVMRGLRDDSTNYVGIGNMMYGFGPGYGMMGYGHGYWGIVSFLSLILVIGLVILVYIWIFRLWKEMSKKQSK